MNLGISAADWPGKIFWSRIDVESVSPRGIEEKE
jgi:hypothetical protein